MKLRFKIINENKKTKKNKFIKPKKKKNINKKNVLIFK